jgi:hypothetical protein
VRAGHHDRDDGQPRLQRGVHEPLRQIPTRSGADAMQPTMNDGVWMYLYLLEGQQPAVLGSCALREQDEGQVVLDHCTGGTVHGLKDTNTTHNRRECSGEENRDGRHCPSLGVALWRLQVMPKIRIFWWRELRNIKDWVCQCTSF